MRRTRIGLPWLLLAVAVLAGACAVPTDSSAGVVAQEDLPETLQRRASTTSTTPPPAAETREVEYYLLREAGEQGQRVVNQVVVEVEQTSLLTPLTAPLFDDDFAATHGTAEDFNTVPEFDLVRVSRPPDSDDDSDVATVVLTLPDPDNPPTETQLRDAAAQLVFTLTAFAAVNAIRIEIDGELRPLPTTGEEGLVDRPVDRDDYAAYNPEEQVETTTTSTSTTTSLPDG